ncbi:pappalysin-1 [Rana temporaria]|uniref:pappalysin-1 n=1 Tax=Rana temporaria TaxID=8407 RepID=UPI001AAC68C7|nr:pappalysin-1 [Rana temporaria]
MLLLRWLLPAVGLLSAALAGGATKCGMDESLQRARRTVRKGRSLRSAQEGSCATSLARGRRSAGGHLRSHQREASPQAPGAALYFTGRGDQLRLNATGGTELPRDTFTLEVWLRAEGGQMSPAVIAGLYDKCTYTSHDRGWVLGIEAMSDQGTRDPRYFFSLKTDRARNWTTITANRNYLPNQWVHLAITYNGRTIKLYVSGAQVATSSEQVGSVFSAFARRCKTLMIGGNALNQNYRGFMEQFRLWNTARTQKEILLDMGQTLHGLSNPLPQLVLQDSFENVKDIWTPMKDGKVPKVEPINFHVSPLDTNLDLPQCGQTLCDNVQVISNYNKVAGFRRPKVIRYTVVNVFDDNHENPTVTKEQIELQHKKLNKAFGPYNITWELNVLERNDSFLRQRLILTNCDITKIGSTECDPECNHKLTGYDGGDCRRRTTCLNSSRKENSLCDMDCNIEELDYDAGACCNPNVTDVTKTCFDPNSPYRAYLDLNELKQRLNVTGSTQLNIFFANSSEEELAGVATWPWDKEVLTYLGGIVMNPSFFGVPGHTHTMIHEIGHSLGLYHVFRGISEILSCSDPCMETEPSYETGDLCHDTNPSPRHKSCGDPNPGPGNETCGFQTFFNTPYNNYMSYADDDCTDSFTPNQVARMHCYLDLVYQGWQPFSKPPPVAIAPQIVEHTYTSVTLEWFPPIDGYIFERDLGSACHLCDEKRILVQYASNASSPVPCNPTGHWSPREAEGRPDVEQPCETSVRTWSPGANDNSVPPACTEALGCYLQLEFSYPVVPQTLTIWVTFITTETHTIRAEVDVRILLVSGEVLHLGPQKIFCDVPLTIKLNFIKVEMYGIQIYTKDNQMEIDAAMITSVPNCPLCAKCNSIHYKVLRDPPFEDGSRSRISGHHRRFLDTSLRHGSVYRYQIVTMTSKGESEPSPELTYHHGSGYCGDGIIQKDLDEECDDRNKINGDGCSLFCHQEPSFHCMDEPSRCYYHDGDGVCEEFERMTSIKDCGVYTPSGFVDQWASNVTVSHHDEDCPGWVVSGQPAANQVCQTKVSKLDKTVSQYAWYPCKAKPDEIHFWLKADFSQHAVVAAAVVHLVTDGTIYSYEKPETISVQLIDVKEQMHDLGVHILSCRNNPLVIPVMHDLSRPFYRSKAVLVSFTSPLVAISGVAFRSFHNFDPVGISSCQRGEVYSVTEQSCINYSCEDTVCPTLVVENAAVDCSNGHYNGAHCEVVCHTGYRIRMHRNRDHLTLDSKIITTCTNGKWNKQISCEPVDCCPLDRNHIYHATFHCPHGTTYRTNCTFHCQLPAILKGINNVLTCMEDGLWSFPEAICELSCKAPPPLPTADLQTSRCKSDKNKVGTTCKYKCKEGHHVPDISRKIRKKAFKIQCTKDGYWTKGGCVPVMCEPPPIKFIGLYQCTHGFQYSSECRLPCEESSTQLDPGHNVIRCQKDGTWSGNFHLCDSIKGPCEPPHLSIKDALVINCGQGFEIGSECNVTCLEDEKKEVVIMPYNVTERNLEHWMNPTRVQRITCTGRHQWYPPPEELVCFKRCEPFIADKYCDGGNNWAFCDYDGGDCCASTVITKEVIPFPAGCDVLDKCACRDPKAKENTKGNNPNVQRLGSARLERPRPKADWKT